MKACLSPCGASPCVGSTHCTGRTGMRLCFAFDVDHSFLGCGIVVAMEERSRYIRSLMIIVGRTDRLRPATTTYDQSISNPLTIHRINHQDPNNVKPTAHHTRQPTDMSNLILRSSDYRLDLSLNLTLPKICPQRPTATNVYTSIKWRTIRRDEISDFDIVAVVAVEAVAVAVLVAGTCTRASSSF